MNLSQRDKDKSSRMEQLWEALNLEIVKEGQSQTSAKLIFIKNRDSSVRWIINANNSKPLFLRFYAQISLRSKLYSILIRLVYAMGIQQWIFSVQKVFWRSTEGQDQIIDLNSEDWAIFTGTPGPNRKVVVHQIRGKDQKGIFCKLPLGANATDLLEREFLYLKYWHQVGSLSFDVPEVLDYQRGRGLWLTDIYPSRVLNKIPDHLLCNYFLENQKFSKQLSSIEDTELSFNPVAGLHALAHTLDSRLPQGLVKKLFWLVEELKGVSFEVCPAHGDFVPWNMKASREKLHLIDWEMGQRNYPLYFDLFHHCIQKGILVDRKSFSAIYSDCQELINHPLLKDEINDSLEKYLSLYLLFQATYYLQVYSKQTNWHTQVQWLFTTWNEALSNCLKQTRSTRQLLILDLFDFLSHRSYACMSLDDFNPLEISTQSDIDLALEKKTEAQIIAYIKTHPLVKEYACFRQSFMNSMEIVLEGGELLYIDLIWSFKRKDQFIMDIDEVLQSAMKNIHGVRMVTASLYADYLFRFYALNEGEIPPKYKGFVQSFYLDQANLTVRERKDVAQRSIQGLNASKGLKKERAKVDYGLDYLRRSLRNRGMIVTFSGIDGAGKSSIISAVQPLIEKTFRRPVVVLRHRPSVLPILSAWKLGKEQAEKASVAKLPRTGTNQSKMGSLIRFFYYYSDYLFGQYYVFWKYTMKGVVVLYDRYYFDFISDSKRSNLVMTKTLPKAAYRFLNKPDINFFLYAQPEVILSRKQELDAPTISELISSYIELFEELSENSSGHYVSIENIKMPETIDKIMKAIKEELIQRA